MHERFLQQARTFEGKKVVRVRYLTAAECQTMGWDEAPLVLQFDDGSLLFPSRDPEGNGAGCLFGQGPNNKELTIPALRPKREYVVPPPLRYEGSLERRHKNMLLRVARGEKLHGRCGRTLRELEDLGYISKMDFVYLPKDKGFWKVVLSKKATAMPKGVS